jgi:hypothetical protein
MSNEQLAMSNEDRLASGDCLRVVERANRVIYHRSFLIIL